jgi:carboxyl-terminal processing protease
VIVGRHTYGKGTVQTLFPMKSASCSLRLTTARFYSPAGKPMAGAGVEPDYASQEGTDAQGRELDVLAGINAARQLLTTNR